MNRRLILIASGAALVVAALWYVALWSPQGGALKKANERVDAATEQQSKLGIELKSLQQSQKNLPARQAQLDALRAAIPDQVALDQVLATIDEAGKGSGVSVANVAPAPLPTGNKPKTGTSSAGTPGGTSGLPEVRITMNATGNYFQLVDFMNRLNGAPRLLVVDTFSLSGSNDKVTTAITGRMFVQPSAVPSTTTTVPASGGAK